MNPGRWALGLWAGAWLALAPAQAAPAEAAAPSPPAAEAGSATCPPPVLPAARAVRAKDRGMLWEIRRDGRTSYLYGTLHLGRPEWQRPGPRVAAALAASTTLALEVDVDDPELLRQMSEAALEAAERLASGSSAGPPAPPPLAPALQQRLDEAARRNCLPLAALAGLPPLMQAASLTLLDARWLGLDPAYGQERALAGIARTRGRRIVSLETLGQQMAAMEASSPVDAEAQLDGSLKQLEDGSARRVLARLAQAWERGDLATLEHYENWCECAPTDAEREQMRRLNDGRNPHLAAGIVAEHARGGRVFAAVGALHMTGPAALPRLLADAGFQVRRVDFAPRPAARAPAAAR